MNEFGETVAEQFVATYRSLRGRVRTEMIDRQLAMHLGPPPGPVVDVGGGAGHQVLPLARRGYDVVIVDPAPAMLARAEEALASVAARVTLVEARGEDAVGAVGDRTFAAVLCHGVVMYVEEPSRLLDALVALTAPGGIVSIVAKNADALAMRPALRGDWPAALAAFDGDAGLNGLGIATRCDTVASLGAELDARGVEPLAWYGVRLFTDSWSSDRPLDDEDVVLAAEWEASRRDPYRQVSRLFHLIGRKVRDPGGPAGYPVIP